MTKQDCIVLILTVFAMTFGITQASAEGSVDWSETARSYKKMTEIGQEDFDEKYKKMIIKGEGRVKEVGKCGFMDKSKKYGRSCYKVVLKKGGSNKVVLYYASNARKQLASLSKGKKLKFDKCQGVAIKNWGFWITQTCDMTGSTAPTAEAAPAAAEAAKPAKSTTPVDWVPVVRNFKGMMDIKQEQFKDRFVGMVLKGKGKITEVGKCSFLDKSQKYDRDCYKVKLERGKSRVVLYFPTSQRSNLVNLRKGSRHKFTNCVGVDIKDWGFWATALCDM